MSCEDGLPLSSTTSNGRHVMARASRTLACRAAGGVRVLPAALERALRAREVALVVPRPVVRREDQQRALPRVARRRAHGVDDLTDEPVELCHRPKCVS